MAQKSLTSHFYYFIISSQKISLWDEISILFEKGIHKVIIFEGQKSCYYEKVIFISICCGLHYNKPLLTSLRPPRTRSD